MVVSSSVNPLDVRRFVSKAFLLVFVKEDLDNRPKARSTATDFRELHVPVWSDSEVNATIRNTAMIRVAVIVSVLGLQIPVEPAFINHVTNVVVHDTSIRVLGTVLDVDDSIILQQDVCISPFTVDAFGSYIGQWLEILGAESKFLHVSAFLGMYVC